MASGIKVRINPAGARAVLQSAGPLVDAQGAKVETAANSMLGPDGHDRAGFARDTRVGTNRARCTVRTATEHAIYANSKRNILLKALGG